MILYCSPFKSYFISKNATWHKCHEVLRPVNMNIRLSSGQKEVVYCVEGFSRLGVM